MRTDRLDGLKTVELDFLKIEIVQLSAKISNVEDTLWKIRTASITLWAAVLGASLGSFSANHEPVVPLLILSCLLPLAFINIDARNNRWYRRFRDRESEIGKYLNNPSYDGPVPFPIYDLGGRNTFKDSVLHKSEFSLLRSLVDPIPLFFYGGQCAFSVAASAIYVPTPLRYFVYGGAAVILLGFGIASVVVRRKLARLNPANA
jgi:hypothetical protein